MNKNLSFLITIHFHQPVGNFDSVIEKVCKNCYVPFLETISKFPEIKFNLHYSGCLLEWMKKNRPEILDKIRGLVQAQQVEMLGGGFYEPILVTLSEQDSVGQVKMLSEFIKDEFGCDVSGAWLAERVWEPHLAQTLSQAGIRYTIVDDSHLRYAGLNQDKLYGYYLTEEIGRCVAIFPSDKFLRYSIPFHPVHESIDYFRKVKDEYRHNCVLYGDDGEKFGEWPGTHDWVYKQKWLHGFLTELRNNNGWLKTMKISDYMKNNASSGRIYLPTASYQEMGEWSLPADSAERLGGIIEELEQRNEFERYRDFLRGGFWRNFLVKYPESNHMHKRMLLISDRLYRLGHSLGEDVKTELDTAQRELYRGQCNCSYWHGIFGGLYLYHLRSAIYEHLISADTIIDSLRHNGEESWVDIEEKDFDCDGFNEFIIGTRRNAFIVDPGEGGTITEWDLRDKKVNLLNTLSRKREAYHKKIKKVAATAAGKKEPATIHKEHFSNPDLVSKELYYDTSRRALFLDHFLPEKIAMRQLVSNHFKDQGNFVNRQYTSAGVEDGQITSVRLVCNGHVNKNPVSISKRFIFDPQKDVICVEYDIRNDSQKTLVLHFAPELNFSLTKDSTREELGDVDSLGLEDKVLDIGVDLGFSQKANKLFRYCVYAISQSEKDIEKHYQATCVVPVFNITLDKNKSKSLSITVNLRAK